MKEFLFSKEELNLIKYLKTNNPIRIWFDGNQYVFDYEEFYIKIKIKLGERFFIDKNDIFHIKTDEKYDVLQEFVMFAKISKIDSKFIFNETSELLNSNEIITDIFVVKTLFYFHKISTTDKNKNYHISSSFNINPNLLVEKSKQSKFCYIVNVGIVIKSNNNYINCFIHNNDDDFFAMNFLYQHENLIENMKDIFEFTKI